MNESSNRGGYLLEIGCLFCDGDMLGRFMGWKVVEIG